LTRDATPGSADNNNATPMSVASMKTPNTAPEIVLHTTTDPRISDPLTV
jgi:hypothetical protein